MKSKYKLEKVTDIKAWDKYIKSSEYGTIFQYGIYLEALEIKHSRYFFYNQNEVRAAFVVTENQNGTEAILDDLVIYNGIIFGQETTGQNRSQKISEQFRINEFIAEQLIKIYQKVEISLIPENTDIRPFLWVNYHNSLPKYNVDVRYTSIIDLTDFATAKCLDDISLYRNATKARRQEIRYAIRDKVVTSEEFDVSTFVSMYSKTLERQELLPSKEKLLKMERLIKALYSHNLLKMFVSRIATNQIASMACFAIDHNKAYYLFGANDTDLRTFHAGTAVIWDALNILSSLGVSCVDLEGVNSPDRGWFKLSFGGELKTYFEISANN